MLEGCIYILGFNEALSDYYKIIYVPKFPKNVHFMPSENYIIDSFNINNIELAENMLSQLLNKFMVNDSLYMLNSFWIKLACTKVKRDVNNDDSIMDVDLPFL